MPRFQFRLATLLRLRESFRDERRGQLAEAYQAERKLRDRREAVQREADELNRLREGAAMGEVNLDRLVAGNRYESILSAEIQTIRQHEAALAPEIEKRRQALMAADREVRVLEKLRESQHERHLRAEAAAEMKLLDEVAARQTAGEEKF